VTPGDQSVEVSVHGFAGPIPLGSREIGCRPPVERGKHEYLVWRKSVEATTARSREQVLEPVPVVTSERYEVLCSQFRAKITGHAAAAG